MRLRDKSARKIFPLVRKICVSVASSLLHFLPLSSRLPKAESECLTWLGRAIVEFPLHGKDMTSIAHE